MIDAPCTGTGTWRRNPDAKWRMRPGALEMRLKDQVEVLDRAAALVKPGGRIAYITCSVLPPENGEQVRAFIDPPSGICGGAAVADRDRCCGTRRTDFAAPRCSRRRAADDPAPDRNGRVFRVGVLKRRAARKPSLPRRPDQLPAMPRAE